MARSCERRLLRLAGHNGVFVRKSMTPDELRRDSELRKEAFERNKGKQAREWVVYRGELRRVADLPKRVSVLETH